MRHIILGLLVFGYVAFMLYITFKASIQPQQSMTPPQVDMSQTIQIWESNTADTPVWKKEPRKLPTPKKRPKRIGFCPVETLC